MSALDKRLAKARGILKRLGSVVIAFSGGVDSSFLARLAHETLGDKALAVTATSETYPAFEYGQAVRVAKEIGIAHHTIHTEELSIAGFKNNPPNRCYFCKKELFQKLLALAKERGFAHVVDGANADDVGDWRPGLLAAKELGVRSPLLEAGLTKQDIRDLSKRMGLSTWDKPSYACLSSRFPYGKTITPEALHKVAHAEEFLRSLGLRQFRVRHHDSIARIEAEAASLPKLVAPATRKRIIKRLKEIGYTYVTLDLEGYRTGSMNEALPQKRRMGGQVLISD
jgi:uncharacterized protein